MRKLFLSCCIFTLYFSSCGTRNSESVMIAAAANTQFAMKEIVSVFEEKYDIPCELIIASSGKLAAQLLEGAPYDLFLSADMYYPSLLHEKNIAKAKPRIYVRGKMAIISSAENVEPLISSLVNTNVKYIAIANPATAPYGKAAKDMLVKMELWERIEDKIVYGESIAQVNQFVFSGAAQLGFTSLSSALAPELIEEISGREIDVNNYTVIEQGAVNVNKSEFKAEHCRKFYNFLFSKEGQEIFSKYGYAKGE